MGVACKTVGQFCFSPYVNLPYTDSKPLEKGQVSPKAHIASERPHLWQRNVPFFQTSFLNHSSTL